MTHREKRLLWLILLATTPFLLGALCSFRQPSAPSREQLIGSGPVEEIIQDFLIVTPFFTPTPTLTATVTPTPTFTPTLITAGQDLNGADGSTSEDGLQGTDAGSGPAATPQLGTPTTVAPPTPSPQLSATLLLPSPTASPSLATPSGLPTPPPPPPTDDPNNDGDPLPPTAPPATVPPPTAPPPTAPPTTAPTASPTSLPPPPPTPTPTVTPPPVVISFGPTSFNAIENQGTATISVTLSSPSTQVVTVDYSTSNGTAFAGFDYIVANGSLTFPAGQVSQAFSVPLINDNVDDPDTETINLTLTNPTNAIFGSNQAQLNISDDDPEPGLSFQLGNFSSLENVTPTLILSLTHPSGKLVSVSYGPNGNGSATPAMDYNLTAFGVVAFGPDLTGVGPTLFSFQWNGGIIDDMVPEGPETVELQLFTPNNAVLTNPVTTTLTILNDD